jgi:hypothetical protein
VHKWKLFTPAGLALSGKQIPRFVEKREWLEVMDEVIGVGFGAPNAGALRAEVKVVSNQIF